jgi:elongation factor Ts
MADITPQMIKDLRERTGAGMADCKKALTECAADMEKAIEFLRKKGIASAAKKATRVASEGTVATYLHGSRIGVLVDYEGPEEAGKDLAMHIAFAKPAYLAKGDVPADMVSRERDIQAARAKETGKPPEITAKMVEGALAKYVAEITLLGQPFVKDDKLSIEQLLKSKGASVASFVLYVVGEGIEKKTTDFAAEVMATAGKAH